MRHLGAQVRCSEGLRGLERRGRGAGGGPYGGNSRPQARRVGSRGPSRQRKLRASF